MFYLKKKMHINAIVAKIASIQAGLLTKHIWDFRILLIFHSWSFDSY